MDTASAVIALLVVFFIILTIFLICREIVCWYFKINKTVELLENILIELRKRP